jgi:hypothetical protein
MLPNREWHMWIMKRVIIVSVMVWLMKRMNNDLATRLSLDKVGDGVSDTPCLNYHL